MNNKVNGIFISLQKKTPDIFSCLCLRISNHHNYYVKIFYRARKITVTIITLLEYLSKEKLMKMEELGISGHYEKMDLNKAICYEKHKQKTSYIHVRIYN